MSLTKEKLDELLREAKNLFEKAIHCDCSSKKINSYLGQLRGIRDYFFYTYAFCQKNIDKKEVRNAMDVIDDFIEDLVEGDVKGD